MKTIVHVVGARPNFVKLGPIHRALATLPGLRQLVVHTGQHFDAQMSDVFFEELRLPTPDVHLGVGAGSHTEQTTRTMVGLERFFQQQRPDLVSVVGDVNSTLAAALVAAQMRFPLAHVEAGLRSFDRTMPEEVNRIVTDRLADYLLTPSADADENLAREGVPLDRRFFVGNVMIDTLLAALPAAQSRTIVATLGLTARRYAVCTLHRAAAVDDQATLTELIEALVAIAPRMPVVFPVHPRTQKRLAEFGLQARLEREPAMKLCPPLGYLDFLALTSQAACLLTDSGGLQEESTALRIPCLTLRPTTERPVTVTVGSNTVIGTSGAAVLRAMEEVLAGRGKRGVVPELWDGRAGERVAQTYATILGLQ